MSELTAERLHRVLATVIGLCSDDGGVFDYCLIGTAAVLLRGVPLAAGDVDLLVRERAHVGRFAHALASYPCLTPPTWLEAARQYYAAFEVDGVKVEASTVEWSSDSGFLETVGTGPWTHFSEIAVGEVHVRTVAIELRLATELRRERGDRVAAITGWIRQNGCDMALLRDAMAAQGLSGEVQSATLAAVAG